MIPNARLCKALLDRITDRAHIIETGTESFRFRRTVEKGRSKALKDAREGLRASATLQPEAHRPARTPELSS